MIRDRLESYLRIGWGDTELYRTLLQYGDEFDPSPRPKTLPKRRDRNCFANATRIALSDGRYQYGEGLAIGALSPKLLDIHHAWLVDENGRAIDPTWREPGRAYFGITLSATELRRAITGSKHYGFFDSNRTIVHEILRDRGRVHFA